MSNGVQSWLWTGASFDTTGGAPVTDRGFRYGMSVFESIRIHNGRALFLDEHLSLLELGCKAAGLTPPNGALVGCKGFLQTLPDGFARVYVTGGDGPVTGPLDDCRVFVFIERRETVPARVYHRGYDLAIHPALYAPLWAGLKTGNYWANVRAFNDGVAKQCNEVLLISPENLLISASMANVFAVIDGKIRTPVSYLCGRGTSGVCRPGVVREWVMRMFRESAREEFIRREEVDGATEMFLTNSWLGVMPVATIEGRRLQCEIGREVLEAYRQEFSIP